MRLHLRQRPTLLLAFAVLLAALAIAVLFAGLPLRAGLLVGWCAGAGTHSGLLLHALVITPPDRMRSHARLLEESRWTVLAATLGAAIAALLGVVGEIGGGARAPYSAPLGIATIALSWAYLHMLFAVQYAHAYWLDGGGIAFPGCEHPDWAEFLYFSYTVGMTAQVSDVTTTSPAMRRLVLTHGLAAFVFNAAILGLAVNVLAGSAAN
ncbi:DUF1345 domain-containing protein [Roseomonas sp. CAU 1739]|uniref:DUF1345 domain-containing protein n=1 Tax=Roseomonas sp. CAU 1739 TaxID=3140364 RepID=UPI00325A70CD